MAEPIKTKYRAFISYSHVDDRWAKWLHSGVERFRIDKDLLGRTTDMGAVPTNLRPVFRDRDEFVAGHTLTEQTRTAISASAALIVLCSPAAAASHYVNEEVRLFKSRCGGRPVIPVILDGIPSDPNVECFPSALKFKVVTDGSLSDEPDEVLAADVRQSADGRDLALAKVIARLLGLNTDDIFRRRARPQKKRSNPQYRHGRAHPLLLAVMGSAVFAWYQSMVARKEQGLKLISDTAFLKAYRASKLLPIEAKPALQAAYKVAVLHHYNRREIAQFSGSGPGDLAFRWKQGEVFSKARADGHYRLMVTERGENGAVPPGDVYLLNNASSRITKLESCFEQTHQSRVEDVSFDHSSRNVFVSRYFKLNVYSLAGECIGKFDLSCCTKSPVHLVEGYIADRFVLAAETKGGLWLVDPQQSSPQTHIKLKGEWSRDASLSATLSVDQRNVAIIFESGRAALLSIEPNLEPRLRYFGSEQTLFAGFYPGENSRLVTTGEDGSIRQWQISDGEIKEIDSQRLPDGASDWIAFSEDGEELLAVGSNNVLYVTLDPTW